MSAAPLGVTQSMGTISAPEISDRPHALRSSLYTSPQDAQNGGL